MLEDFPKQNLILFCKQTQDTPYQLKVTGLNKHALICQKPADLPPITNTEWVFSFIYDKDRYFFRSILRNADGTTCDIPSQIKIYKLQRRDAHRVIVPDTYPTKIELIDAAQKNDLASGTVLDISTTGCKIVLRGKLSMKAGEILEFRMHVGKRDPVAFSAEVIEATDLPGAFTQKRLRLKFRNVNSFLEADLFAITMELYREIMGKVRSGDEG